MTNEFFSLRGRLSLVTSNDVPVARFYWTPEFEDKAMLLAVEDSQGMKFVLSDWNRNPIGWVNLDTGDHGRIDYDAWGRENGESPFPWIGLCSQLSDRQIGCVFFAHRTYNPEDARWTAPDPLSVLSRDPRHPADYRYLDNDPVTGWDHGGLIKFYGCSSDQQEKIRKQIESLCAEGRSQKTSCCFKNVNNNAGTLIFSDLNSLCSNWDVVTTKVGCTSKDDCVKMNENGGMSERCGFVCKTGSQSTPLCADKQRDVPYLCPSAFDGTCDIGPGCTYFHERSHVTLQNVDEQEEIIRGMEKCLGVCAKKNGTQQ